MPMPGRNGIAYQSTWVPGRGFVAGNSYPDYLQVATRPYAPTPNAYRAGKEVELLPGFETATGTDELLVEIQAGSGVLSNDYPGGQGSNDMYGAYRYGFNGKENDNDVKGTGNQQDYGFRIYDPRLGRFLSVDPLTQEYPWYTPYQFAGNTPIQAIDLDGLEPATPLYIKQKPVLEVSYENDPSSWTQKADGWEVNNQFGYALLTNAGYYLWDYLGGRSLERFVKNRQIPEKNNFQDIVYDFYEFSLATISIKGFNVKGGRFADVPSSSGTGRHELLGNKSMQEALDAPQKNNPVVQLPNKPHSKTGSYGAKGADFRAAQTSLLKEGKFKEAFEMGVNDLRQAFNNNKTLFEASGVTIDALEAGIKQATEYFEKKLLPSLEKQYKEAQKQSSSTKSSIGD
jgi:RHS repeat-associated protein